MVGERQVGLETAHATHTHATHATHAAHAAHFVVTAGRRCCNWFLISAIMASVLRTGWQRRLH